jgi:hypothetical protein
MQDAARYQLSDTVFLNRKKISLLLLDAHEENVFLSHELLY